jgi:hypothetical protein
MALNNPKRYYIQTDSNIEINFLRPSPIVPAAMSNSIGFLLVLLFLVFGAGRYDCKEDNK